VSVSRTTGPFDLSKTPIHLPSETNAGALPLPGFGFDPPAFERYIAEHCRPDAPGRLVMVEASSRDWTMWECHTAGDELVIVLEGRGEFVQELDGQERRTPVGSGSAIVNPAGVWHTANVHEPMKALYLTPCPGTRHRPR